MPQSFSSEPSSLAPSASPAGPSNRRVKGKRTRTGCLTCRTRKVKCDESKRPTCANCERVMLECRWPTIRNVLDDKTMANSIKAEPEELWEQREQPSSGPIRWNRLAIVACVACTKKQVACSGERPSCSNCLESNMTCMYAPRSNSGATIGSTTEDYQTDDSLRRTVATLHGIPRPVLEEHIDAFFKYVYPIQGNAIIHRGTLMRDVTEGRVARKVLLAICAISSRFVSQSGGGGGFQPLSGSIMAKAWAAEAKVSLLEDAMSIDNVTTALILAKHEINSGRIGHAFVLAAVATRMALALRLHQELPPDDPATTTERETRRRLMWGCYSLDRMMCTGVPEYEAVPVDSMHIRLPCDDSLYWFGTSTTAPFCAIESEGEGEGLQERYADVGLFGHHLRMQGIRIVVFRSSRTRRPGDLPPWDRSSVFSMAERKLDAWHTSLTSQFLLEPETIYARNFQNQLSALLMLHLWYSGNRVELYRLALPGFHESLEPEVMMAAPPGWIDQTREACVHHAKMNARMIRHVCEFVGTDFVFTDPALPVSVLEAVRIRLQNAFLQPPEQQALELSELIADASVLDLVLQPMTKYYRQVVVLLKEMRRMLRRHGLECALSSAPSADTSGANSPSHDPWSARLRHQRNNPPSRPTIVTTPASQPSSTSRSVVPNVSQILPDNNITYSEPSYLWNEPLSRQPTQQQIHQDDVTTILNQYTPGSDNSGPQGGSGSGFAFLSMFADWVATGYDPNVPLPHIPNEHELASVSNGGFGPSM